VALCLLLKQALDQGATLPEAVPTAQAYVANQLRTQPQRPRFDPALRRHLARPLRSAEHTGRGLWELGAGLIHPR
jgi:hypothetical protein